MDEGKEGLTIRPGFVIPEGELHFSYARSSGPGGQHVNKTSTKVRLKWRPSTSAAVQGGLAPAERARLLSRARKHQAEDGAVQVVSDATRSRETNREACRKRLKERIRTWLRKPKKRIPTRPTRASKERRLQEKKRKSHLKKDRRDPHGE